MKGEIRPDPKEGKFIIVSPSPFLAIGMAVIFSPIIGIVIGLSFNVSLGLGALLGVSIYYYYDYNHNLPTTKKYVYVSGKFQTKKYDQIEMDEFMQKQRQMPVLMYQLNTVDRRFNDKSKVWMYRDRSWLVKTDTSEQDKVEIKNKIDGALK